MKTRLPLVAGAALLLNLAIPSQPLAADLRIFIFAGQSNMVGKGKAEELPQGLKNLRAPQLDVLYAARESESRSEPVDATGVKGNPWSALQPVEGTFGPEISFGRMIVDNLPQARIAIVKIACADTALAADWNPEAKNGLQLYSSMLAFVRTAVAGREKEGDTAHIAGFIWYQGEADSHNEEMSKAYRENLRRFFDRVRSDLKAPELPIVAVRIGVRERDPGKFEPMIRSAIEAVCSSEPHTAWISVDELKLVDGQHLNSAGEIEAGQRLATAWLNLTQKK